MDHTSDVEGHTVQGFLRASQQATTREAATVDHLAELEALRQLSLRALTMAHDFNNALSTILGRAQLALDEADPKSRRHLQIIEQTALDATATVHQFQQLAGTVVGPASLRVR